MLADWIINKDPNYPTFGECKLWIKRENPRYVISKNDEKKNSNIFDLSSYEPTHE